MNFHLFFIFWRNFNIFFKQVIVVDPSLLCPMPEMAKSWLALSVGVSAVQRKAIQGFTAEWRLPEIGSLNIPEFNFKNWV